jgi:hypothetical protein
LSAGSVAPAELWRETSAIKRAEKFIVMGWVEVDE